MSAVIEPARSSVATALPVVINERLLIPKGLDQSSFERWREELNGVEGRVSWQGEAIQVEVPTDPGPVDPRQRAAIHAVMADVARHGGAAPNGNGKTTSPPIALNGWLTVPAGVVDLESFQRWSLTLEGVNGARVAYLSGVLWVDLTMEQAYWHNQVKIEIGNVLYSLAKADVPGRYFGDGMSLEWPPAHLNTAPDGLFVAFATFQAGRVRQMPGLHGGVTVFNGAPDMVLEVVSDSSVEKDTVILPGRYRQTGIPEFWRADARGDLRFEIFRLTGSDHVPTQTPDGWWRSDVFARDFRLTRQTDPLGQPLFTLEMRP
jgi:Uma2 family endonuclease